MRFAVGNIAGDVIQGPKPEPRIMRCELRVYEGGIIKPLLPTKSRGVAFVNQQGALANIPPKRNRKDPICFSPYVYWTRNQVERFFNKIVAGSQHATTARSQLPCLHQAGFDPHLATRL